MIPKPLPAITSTDIDQLVANGVSESRTIEYKEELPGGSDTERKEFANDVCAFANAGGGDIIYGIAADDGVPKSVAGCTDAIADKVKLRLEQMISTSIRPRVRAEAFSVPGCTPPVFVLRIHPSFNTPHMVTNSGPSRFWMRGSAGKRHLDVDEIRQAFEMSGGVAERIREFRADRLIKIDRGDTPFPLPYGGESLLVMHVVPVAAGLIGKQRIDPSAGRQVSLSLQNGTLTHRYNLDGYASARIQGDYHDQYVQLFRDGSIETVAQIQFDRERRGLLPVAIHDLLTTFSKEIVSKAPEMGIAGPVFIMVSLLNVRDVGFYLSDGRRTLGCERLVFDRSPVALPEWLLETFEEDRRPLLRSIFDGIWQAAGYPDCQYLSADYRWKD